MTTTPIGLQDLRRKVVVNRASLAVAQGEMVALLGPSGCGKTTLLRMIAGLETPHEGEIWIVGERMALPGRNVVPTHRRGVGFVFQDLALWPHFTVAGNLDFVLASGKVSEEERKSRIHESLHRVRIEAYADRLPTTLSGGEQQRLAITRAIVSEPRVLLLDEPMSNLDAALKAALRAELLALQQALGLTTLLVTHDEEEAQALADRVLLMNNGRIVETADAIYSKFVAGGLASHS